MTIAPASLTIRNGHRAKLRHVHTTMAITKAARLSVS